MSEVLSCSNLTKTYLDAGMQVEVLTGVNLSVDAGEKIAIVGASGSGKSTLLHILGGLDKPSSGEVLVAGQNMTKLSATQRGQLRNQALGFVYQFHHLLAEFSALENVAMPLLIRGEDIHTARQQADEMLTRVGLAHRLHHKPGELSGGERQRAALARALVTKPQCILADEPTGNLDHDNAVKMFDLMMDLNKHYETSFVIVTHDQQLARMMDRVLKIENGIIN
jgi:lipoprotein-releasing system ATP-binding protein